MSSRSASIGAFTHSTPSARCSESLAKSPRRRSTRFIRASGSTLHVVPRSSGECQIQLWRNVMIVREQTEAASLEFLARVRLGRLACAQNNQPYVVPFYFACHGAHLYSFSTVGQKIAWMRANPLVCVEADEVEGPHHWISVVVSGRYQELPDTPELRGTRELAYRLLSQNATW